MHTVKRSGWVVARKAGSRLFLAGHAKADMSFGGMSTRTAFFSEQDYESEMARLGVPLAGVVKTPVSLEMRVGH